MTDVINRISALKAKVDKHQKSSPVETRSISTQATTANCPKLNNHAQQTVKPKQTATQPNPSPQNAGGACGFGGMKKGFLAGGLETKKQLANTKSLDSAADGAEMPHIKSNPSKSGDHLVMQEVQRMRDQLQKTGLF